MKKRKEEEHENLERWLITYSDLITLLLAFFIMMYTFSKQDAQKYQEVSEHLKTIFAGGSSLLKTGSQAGATVVQSFEKTNEGKELKQQLENQVKSLPDSEETKNKISIFRDERGLVIRITERAFFDEGRAELKETAKAALKKIVPTIENSGNHVRIEGHTDNVPIKTSEFNSNWELSVKRATEVVRHLIEKYDFSPAKISASGYAEYRPVAANDTPGNRALNRRIEIILIDPPKPQIARNTLLH
jgi:chemotaxis protein MotB